MISPPNTALHLHPDVRSALDRPDDNLLRATLLEAPVVLEAAALKPGTDCELGGFGPLFSLQTGGPLAPTIAISARFSRVSREF